MAVGQRLGGGGRGGGGDGGDCSDRTENWPHVVSARDLACTSAVTTRRWPKLQRRRRWDSFYIIFSFVF